MERGSQSFYVHPTETQKNGKRMKALMCYGGLWPSKHISRTLKTLLEHLRRKKGIYVFGSLAFPVNCGL